MSEQVNHPAHYGGGDNVYECIKVIEAWQLGFNLGNAVKYISRAGKKGDSLTDLKKAAWYLNRKIENLPPPTAPTPSLGSKEEAGEIERLRAMLREFEMVWCDEELNFDEWSEKLCNLAGRVREVLK